MHTTVTTTTVLSITQTVEEWRAILADDTAFKSELRAKLAEIRANEDPRTNHVTINEDRLRSVKGTDIAASAKKQNKKTAARFLAPSTATYPCEFCDKTFQTSAILNRHKGRMHKAELTEPFPSAAQDADEASDE